MAKTENINIRIEPELKKEAEQGTQKVYKK